MLYHCFANFKQSPLDFFRLGIVQLSKSYNQWCSPITCGLLGS